MISTVADRPASRKASGAWMTAGGIVLSAGCLSLALRGTDVREIGATLSRAHAWLIIPLVVLQVLYFAFKAVRWRMLLEPIHHTSAMPLVAPMMIGFMGNNVLPARLGELIRIYLAARLMRVAPSQVLATLVLERMFDFIAVLAFLGLAVVLLGNVPESFVSAGYIAAALSVVAVAGASVYVVRTQQLLRVVERSTCFLPRKVGRLILRQLELGASGMGALRNPKLLAGIVTTSLLQWFLMAACVYCSFLAMDVDAPPSAAFVVLIATVFGVMVPAAPGFIGTIHLAFVLALKPFSVSDNAAMAAAVFYHAIPYLGVTLTGLFFLRQTGVRLREVEREALDT